MDYELEFPPGFRDEFYQEMEQQFQKFLERDMGNDEVSSISSIGSGPEVFIYWVLTLKIIATSLQDDVLC